ncbi:WG repeat-containing protein [Actinoplanes sp. CA-030573]|uniref:WG repeat-containing protein n=1 Tax=Actinoplanes sp. CA-030573 TaxID=3239898 RepID=UPI003D931842
MLPDGPQAGSRVDPVTAPPVVAAAEPDWAASAWERTAAPEADSTADQEEEPRGLGWLLSQSGLGATTPVVEPGPANASASLVSTPPAVQPAPEPEPPVVVEPEVTPDPEPESPVAVEPESPVAVESELAPDPEPEPPLAVESELTPDPEPESPVAVEPDATPEPAPVLAVEPDHEPEPESAPMVEPDLEPEPETAPTVGPEVALAAEPDHEPEPEVALAAEQNDEPEPEAALAAERDHEPEPEAALAAEPDVAVESEPQPEPEPVAAGPEDAAEPDSGSAEQSWFVPVTGAQAIITPSGGTVDEVAEEESDTAPGTDIVEEAVEAELVDIEPVDAMWVEAEVPVRVEESYEPEPLAIAAPGAEEAGTEEAAPGGEEAGTEEAAPGGEEAGTEEAAPASDAIQAENEPEAPPEVAAESEIEAQPEGAAELERETRAEREPETGSEDERPAEVAVEEAPAPGVRETETPQAEAAPPRRTTARARRADPEEMLATYPWSFDATTLREEVDDPDQMWTVVDRLTDKLEYAERDAVRARLLSLRAVAERLLGELDAALEDAREALGHAEATGELGRIAIVRARLAHVHQWRGEYAEADKLYAEASSPELPSRLRAEIEELAGRSAFDQGRYLESMNHFETALDLRKGADPELVERIEAALDTITKRTSSGGWGPYPRTRDEISGIAEPPRPIRDERTGLWGYVGAVPPRYAQAQPFADELAWVRRPDAAAWELIDLAGEVVIDASAGYLAAERFSEGLAWVSRDEDGGWYAIDRLNRLIVPGGFDDAKAFHHGLALIKRGGWGVIDRHGRVLVQPRYRAFLTPLVSGGPIEGFTDEGLAVVEGDGERFGVVDRTGRLIVPPEHAAVVIHPTAFLVSDRFGLWGALDRDGRPLIELRYREQADVLDEIDRRLTDGRPVL